MSGNTEGGNKMNAIIAVVVVVILLAAFIVFRTMRRSSGGVSGEAAVEPTLSATPSPDLLNPGGGPAGGNPTGAPAVPGPGADAGGVIPPQPTPPGR